MHWLDRLSPTLQKALSRYARHWWFKSLVDARRRPGQALERVADGHALREALEEQYEKYYAKHHRPGMDGRVSTHVSTERPSVSQATPQCSAKRDDLDVQDRVLAQVAEVMMGQESISRRAALFTPTCVD